MKSENVATEKKHLTAAMDHESSNGNGTTGKKRPADQSIKSKWLFLDIRFGKLQFPFSVYSQHRLESVAKGQISKSRSRKMPSQY